MNRIDAKFRELREAGKTALIPFVTVGDPDLPTSLEILKQLEAAGADLIELGVPYSDPLADGPVIQRASGRALQHKVTIVDCIRVAKQAREAGVTVPFILFSYFNPVLQLGLDNCISLLQEHDISGLIIPDLPYEEDEQVKSLADRAGIHLIPLVAPTSKERIVQIARQARGFVYCVSSLGVTGVRSEFYGGVDDFLQTVRQATDLPIAIGFGISSNEQFRKFAQTCDGVVVGSAIVKKIEEVLSDLSAPHTRELGLRQIKQFVGALKA